ncbi:MAG: hypothetical protein AAB495_00905 [Patescibacteria group bacterium]
MKKTIYFFGGVIMFLSNTVIAASAPPVNPTFPGISGRVGPAAFILDFYNFALALGGLLAFIMILYAGIRYAASRGNPSSQSDAKDAITQALLGLLLLMGAYIILRTINPELVTLKLPVIERLNVPPPPTGPFLSGTGCQGTCAAITSLSCKNGCEAAAPMVEKLECMAKSGGTSGFWVTEGMPPSVLHQSACHNNGCCVDIALQSGSTVDCGAVKRAIQAAQACGATVKNEYLSCGGEKTTYWTSHHIHIVGC